ncbi:MAG: hypothetical protein IJX02_04215 [Clostridia bacterium]|nr:hypothetical protein [Clostridia bacterium]
MILLLGNNEYRRHDIYLSLLIKKYTVAEHSLEYMDFYTKPFITVYINPTYDEIKKIKNEKTISILVKSNLRIKPAPWLRVIPDDKNVAKEIMKIYEESCPYGKGREIFGIIAIEGKKMTVGGEYLNVVTRQRQLIKLLLYNADKRFALYDIASYIRFDANSEERLAKMVKDLNVACRMMGKEPIITVKNDYYQISQKAITY